MRKKEERLNTMNSFANGFKIIRDNKIITLTPEEMSDFRFFDKAIEGRDNLYTYGCNKAKSQKELDAIAELVNDPAIQEKNWEAQILETSALGSLTVTAPTKDEAISILKIISQYRKYAPSSWHLFVQIPENLDVFEEHVTCSEISKEPLVSVRVNINGGNGYKFSDVTSDAPRMLVMYSRYDESSKELLEGTPWKLEFEYDECIKGLSGECVPYKEQDEIVHKANQKLGEVKFKIKDIQYHNGCIIDCGKCGICESFDCALVFLRIDDLYKKARFGDKGASRKLFCLLDENIREFARWIATSKEEAKKEIFELSEMFKDFYC